MKLPVWSNVHKFLQNLFQLSSWGLLPFSYRKQQSECQSELESLRQQLNLVTSQRDTRVKLEMHQKELSTNENTREKTIVHYIDKMEKHRSNARPLCHREFNEVDETLELIQELKSSVE